jgi:hypothetical protein
MLDFQAFRVGDSKGAVSPTDDADDPDPGKEESMMSRWFAAALVWAVSTVAAAGAADAQVQPRFVLSGIVVTDGGGRAWLQEPQLTQNQTVSVRVGETIGPYRLTKVLDDRVELLGPGGALSVMLAGASGPPNTTAAPVTKAAPPPPDPDSVIPPERQAVLPPGPPLAPLPPGTPRVDFGSLLRGLAPSK